MNSIFALIGLRGSNAEKAASELLYLMIGNSFLAVSLNMIQTDVNYYLDIMIMLSIFGVWLILSWQLEYHIQSDIAHYLGVLMVFVVGMTAFLIQQNFSNFSVGLIIFTIISGVGWQVLGAIKFEKGRVHLQSLLRILLESFAMFNAALALALYIFHLGN